MPQVRKDARFKRQYKRSLHAFSVSTSFLCTRLASVQAFFARV
jgi:hypothetical protein